MSDYALAVVRELYGVGQVQFMREWYDRMPDISSMWFVELELKKKEIQDEE